MPGEWETQIKFQQLLAKEAGLDPSKVVEGVNCESMRGSNEVMLEFKVLHWVSAERYMELRKEAQE